MFNVDFISFFISFYFIFYELYLQKYSIFIMSTKTSSHGIKIYVNYMRKLNNGDFWRGV